MALLKQEPGADFALVAPRLPPGQLYAQGERFHVPDRPAEFRVGVCVRSASFGAFEQWVVFDFGRRPVLLRKLGLQLGPAPRVGPSGTPAPGRLEELERWHTGNRHVVPGVARTAEQLALMAKYKVPALALEFRHGGPGPSPFSPTNYRQRMHQFLYEEEAAQQRLVAKCVGPVGGQGCEGRSQSLAGPTELCPPHQAQPAGPRGPEDGPADASPRHALPAPRGPVRRGPHP